MTKVVMARACILLVDDEPPFLTTVKNFLENSKRELAGSFGLLGIPMSRRGCEADRTLRGVHQQRSNSE